MIFLEDAKQAAMLRGLMDGYCTKPKPVIFVTNRLWIADLPTLRLLYPQFKVIACVRNPAWILDSVETLLRKNPVVATRMFGSPMEQI